jgi:hypothetical protein
LKLGAQLLEPIGGISFASMALKCASLGCVVLFLALASVSEAASEYRWTWLSGQAATVNFTGSYGTLGITSESNLPPGRQHAEMWCDPNSQSLFLYGGEGDPSTSYKTIFLFTLNIKIAKALLKYHAQLPKLENRAKAFVFQFI